MSSDSNELTEPLLDRTTSDRIGTVHANSVRLIAALVQGTPMIEISDYTLSAVREGELTLHRGRRDGLDPILLVAPTGEGPPLESIKRLEHEYTLRSELDSDWAAKPLMLAPFGDRVVLVLDDRGGEPLDRLLFGQALDVPQFLRLAIPLANACRRMHGRGLIHKDIKPANVLATGLLGRHVGKGTGDNLWGLGRLTFTRQSGCYAKARKSNVTGSIDDLAELVPAARF